MVGEPRSLRPSSQLFETFEMFPVQGLRRAEIHRNPVLHDPILIEDVVEHLQRPSTVDHIVLGDDLKPVDDGLLGKNVLIVRNA